MNSLMKNVNQGITNLPAPSSLNYFWNFGSLLSMCLCIQIVSGLFLAFHYEASMSEAFSSVISIMNDLNWGWLIRLIHSNGASLFFVCLFIHVGRGLFYSSYEFSLTWMIGIVIIFVLMGSAFMGYVLPWGQMSFWGATVITNLLSTIPYIGDSVVTWLWGGFSVSKPTLIRFFAFHFILPFFLAVLVLIHILSLHSSGSSNPLGLDLDSDKINFHPYYSIKDVLGVIIVVYFFAILFLSSPDSLMDPDNFMIANPMNTPVHIQPEWYFLFAYAILRSIPNKLGGVIALTMSILMLSVLAFKKKNSSLFMPLKKVFFWMFVCSFILLTWLGMMPVEPPFVFIGQVVSVIYFMLIVVL